MYARLTSTNAIIIVIIIDSTACVCVCVLLKRPVELTSMGKFKHRNVVGPDDAGAAD